MIAFRRRAIRWTSLPVFGKIRMKRLARDEVGTEVVHVNPIALETTTGFGSGTATDLIVCQEMIEILEFTLEKRHIGIIECVLQKPDIHVMGEFPEARPLFTIGPSAFEFITEAVEPVTVDQTDDLGIRSSGHSVIVEDRDGENSLVTSNRGVGTVIYPTISEAWHFD